MLLVLDIGNTNLTLGLVAGGAIVATRRAGTTRDRDRRRAGAPARRAPRARRAGPRGHLGAGASPPSSRRRPRRSRRSPTRRGDPAPRRRRPATCRWPCGWTGPHEVGADRLVNALAAARLYGTPAIVVDFGTATTFDCVGADGAFLGGAIAPGPRARPGGAGGEDRAAAADGAADAGPGDRARHRQRDAVGRGLRLPGDGLGAARARSAPSSRRRPAASPRTCARS